MTFEVKRSEWVRGESTVSALLVEENDRDIAHPDRKRCCLGFFAKACGIPDSQISGLPTPAVLQGPKPASADWNALMKKGMSMSRVNSDLCGELMNCNDNRDLTDDERETKLAQLFSKLGHTVVFVD